MKKLNLGEEQVEPEIDVLEAKQSHELDREVNKTEARSTSSDEANSLLHSHGKANLESLQPHSIENSQINKEGNADPNIVKIASVVDENRQSFNDDNAAGSILDADLKMTQSEDFVKQGSLLDIDVGISEADHFVEEYSSTRQSDSVSKTDGEYKELCIDTNIRLVTCAVRNQSELVMLMKMTNHNQSRVAVEGISLKIEPPSNLIADTSDTEITVEKLSFLETVSIILC